jgi:hypothetical protein
MVYEMKYKDISFSSTEFKSHKSEFDNCKFLNVNLTGIEFKSRKSEFDNCKFLNVDLTGIDFTNSSFRNVLFKKCVLNGANFTNTSVNSTKFHRCGLQEANFSNVRMGTSYFHDCNLTKVNFTNADLINSCFIDVDMDTVILTNANVSGIRLPMTKMPKQILKCKGFPEEIVKNDNLLKEIAAIVLNDNEALEMFSWHTSDTIHCMAGWAIHLHPQGYQIEAASTTVIAAKLLLGDEAESYFYVSNEEAIELLKGYSNDQEE